jgi:hypothetical protein
VNYHTQQTDELLNEIDILTTAAQSGSWERNAACTLKIQTILSELARRGQDKQTKAMLSMTRWITVMTAVVTIATLLQLYLAWNPATPNVAQPASKTATTPAQPAR